MDMERGRAPTSGRVWFILALILLVAIGLRFTGLNWALPGDIDIGGAFYHPSYFGDETSWVLNIYYAWVGQRKLYDTASVHLGHGPGAEYLNTAAVLLGVATGYIQKPGMDGSGYRESRKFFHQNPELMRRVYFLPRIGAALFGVLTVWVVWRLGCALAGTAAGLVAAAVIAVCPLHVVFSHFARSDGYATLFVALTMWLAHRVHQTGRLRDFLIAGFVAGLSTGVKYPNWLFSISIIVAFVLLKREGRGAKGSHLGLSVLSGIIGFLLFVPAAVLSPYGKRGFFYWLDENFKQLADPNHWSELRIDWWIGYGHEGMVKGLYGFVFPGVLTWTLYLLVAISFFWMCFVCVRRQRQWLIVVIPSVLYLLLSLRSDLLVERWMDMLTPSMALAVGFFAASPRPAWRRALVIVLTTFALAHALLFSAAYVNGMRHTDNRSIAAKWMEDHATPNTTVGMAKPQLQTTQTRLNWDKFKFAEVYYNLAVLDTANPEYYILHTQDYRFFDLYPSSRAELPAAYDFIQSFREERRYRKVAEFKNEARLGPWVFPVANVSSWDWPFQTVTIYQRKDIPRS